MDSRYFGVLVNFAHFAFFGHNRRRSFSVCILLWRRVELEVHIRHVTTT